MLYSGREATEAFQDWHTVLPHVLKQYANAKTVKKTLDSQLLLHLTFKFQDQD